MESMSYTKEECIKWLRIPDQDPITQKSLFNDHAKFVSLLKSCRNYFQPMEIGRYNKDMVSIIYPLRYRVKNQESLTSMNGGGDDPESESTGVETITEPESIDIGGRSEEIEQESEIVPTPEKSQGDESEEGEDQGEKSEEQDDESEEGEDQGGKNEEQGEKSEEIEEIEEIEEGDEGEESATVMPMIRRETCFNQVIKPDDLDCVITKLTDDKIILLNSTILYQDIDINKILEQLNNDQFIKQLLASEQKLLEHKLKRYQECQALMPDDYQTYVNDIKKRIKSIKDDDQNIKQKRDDLIGFIKSLDNLIGDTHQFIKKVLCQKILHFAISSISSDNFNYIIIGNNGSGKNYVIQYFAKLYRILGIIQSDRIVHHWSLPFTTQFLERLIVIKHKINPYELQTFVNQYRDLFNVFVILKHDQDSTVFHHIYQEMINVIPQTIHLPNYSGEDLFAVLLHLIKQIYPSGQLSGDQINHLKQIITTNVQLFDRQSIDMVILGQQLVSDWLLIEAQNQTYDEAKINQTISKYFIKRGKYITFDDYTLNLTTITEFLPTMKELLTSNLLSREMILTYLDKDDFIKDVVESKKKLLSNRLNKYQDLCDNADNQLCREYYKIISTLQDKLKQFGTNNLIYSETRKALKQTIDDIDMIQEESSEHIRKLLYSQIYLFSKLNVCQLNNLMNYIIVSQNYSSHDALIKVIDKMCQQIGFTINYNGHPIGIVDKIPIDQLLEHMTTLRSQIDQSFNNAEFVNTFKKTLEIHKNLCGITIIHNQISGLKELEQLFPNYIIMLPYTSNDLYQILIRSYNFDQLLSPTQKDYIRDLIDLINKKMENIFSRQASDMMELARCIYEDIIVHGCDHYDLLAIHRSFQLFFYNKGYYLDFFYTGKETSRLGYGIEHVFNRIKKLRQSYFK
ncbi:MAG: hypothetical protein ABIN35_00815 [candidate division WOR-3 bacterium]